MDARSTGPQLKDIVLRAMAENWHKYTFGFPLTPDHFMLQLCKSNVDLTREFKDSPVIYDQCLTWKGPVKGCFSFGQIIRAVMLLDAMEYEAVDSHIQESRLMVSFTTLQFY